MLLMKKNDKVADISISQYGNISAINKVYDSTLFPIGVFYLGYELGNNPEQDAKRLNDWWLLNSIPTERDSIRIGLEKLGIQDVHELKILGHGLSLLNFYWIKDSNDPTLWEDINYWDHPFSPEIGEALFNHKAVRKNPMMASPDSGINGMLKKKWLERKDGYYLIKSGTGLLKEDVYNEVLASDLMECAGISHAEYQLCKEDSNIYCMSKCLTDAETEMIMFSQIMDLLPRKHGYHAETELEYVYRICDYLGVDDYQKSINDMLCIDFILAGFDRHYSNIALLYRNGNYSFCPIYDSGNCLWNSYSIESIKANDEYLLARPFCDPNTYGTWGRQKQYIYDYIGLSKDDFVKCLLKHIQRESSFSEMKEERIKKIAASCFERAYDLQQFLVAKGCFISDEVKITRSDIDSFQNMISDKINVLQLDTNIVNLDTEKLRYLSIEES